MIIDEIRSNIESIAKNSAIFEERNFDSRAEATDYLEFNIIDRIDGLLTSADQPEAMTALKQSAEKVKRQLESVDDALFQRLRTDIRNGVCTGAALRAVIGEYVRNDLKAGRKHDGIGYGRLDVFINGLLLVDPLPVETKTREPEMVFYQQTPARIILDLIDTVRFTEQDVLYDLGSGLGQVPILSNLLTGVTAKGIEFEPSYCDYARERAAALKVSRVEFINADARDMDYSQGTVFFMYTPFTGAMLQQTLEKLHSESNGKMIRLFTYGPCTQDVSRQQWLESVVQNGCDPYKLGGSRSV